MIDKEVKEQMDAAAKACVSAEAAGAKTVGQGGKDTKTADETEASFKNNLDT